MRAVARNDARAEVGQRVVVESSTKNLLGVMLLVYLLPIVLFLVGYFATGALESEGPRYCRRHQRGVFSRHHPRDHLATAAQRKRGKLTFTIVRLFLRHVWLHQAASSPHPQRAGRSALPVRFTAGCANTNSGESTVFAARFVLNFDFTFLAILLSDAQEPECESCRCAAHPCKAQCVMAHTVALETAADHSLVLAWWQLRDHIEDHGFFKAIPYRLAALLLRWRFTARRE
ncbi:MAG: SoxR reducing system RseC family protein [Oscillibacter sp.]